MQKESSGQREHSVQRHEGGNGLVSERNLWLKGSERGASGSRGEVREATGASAAIVVMGCLTQTPSLCYRVHRPRRRPPHLSCLQGLRRSQAPPYAGDTPPLSTTSHRCPLSLSSPMSSLRSPLRKSPLTLEDFKFLAVLGRGHFGKVRRWQEVEELGARTLGSLGWLLRPPPPSVVTGAALRVPAQWGAVRHQGSEERGHCGPG